MEFIVLNEDEYKDFYNSNSQSSFMQSVEIAHLKRELGSIIHYLGVKKNKKIVAASLILEDKSLFNRKIFYAPRGLILDYTDKELLTFFVESLKKYIKNRKGFKLIIDPNVIYRYRNSDGIIIDNNQNDEVVNNLKSIGFKHYGFNKYLETLQARWCYYMFLDKDYNEKMNSFSKSTKKNIESCKEKGLQVRKGTIDDLSTMSEIFELTSKRKDFFSRSLSYYQKMYKHLSDIICIYIAYLEPNKRLESTNKLLKEEKENLERLEKEISGNNNVGAKLYNKYEISKNKVEKYLKMKEEALKFINDYPNGKDIGCLLSIKSGNEYLTLSSGVLEEYKSFTPKYLMYEKHIQDAYKMGMYACNFYGITGDFDPKNKYYGIYEFKRGFSGNVIEYIGEFEIKTSNFYYIYNLLKKIKKVIKNQ